MNNELKQKILHTIQSFKGKQFRRRELFNLLGIEDLGYDEYKKVLAELEESGVLSRKKGRKFVLSEAGGKLVGVFSASRNGGGWVNLPDGQSFHIKPVHVWDAFPGDTVQIAKLKKGIRGMMPSAKILEVIEHSTQPVIGIFRKHGAAAYVVPQANGFPGNLIVKNSGDFAVNDGDLVVCRVEAPSGGYSRPLCVLTEVLGDPESPGVDVLAIAKRYQLPITFPKEVIHESERIQDGLDGVTISGRRDIRGMVAFTIDPEDAKDFDDAISITRGSDGGYDLGVHIADVAHYVRDGSAMDTEARTRGMSCYLVDRVIPMLPERLSNGLCSLNPREDRLTKSVFITLDRDGNVLKYEAADTVINSHSRLNYRQVQDFLNSGISEETECIPPEVGEALIVFSELADTLIERRNERGAIDMELPETKVILDDCNKPVDIVKRDRVKSHRMIEEAMLLANTIVAHILAETDAPFLYRIHDKPDEKKMEAFSEAASLLGYKFKSTKARDPRYVLDFLMSLKGRQYENILNKLFLRSMKKAGYSPKNIGHYGLAMSEYAHFTSPIRRYPDLLVHRQLNTYVFGDGDRHTEHAYTYYEMLGDSITRREIITDNAERDSVKMKAAEFMHSRLGEEYEGTIVGIMPVGLFVEIDEYYVEGLIHVSSLFDDYYDVDSSGFALVGKRSGRRFVIGDRVLVIVASSDKTRGEINFHLEKKYKKKKS